MDRCAFSLLAVLVACSRGPVAEAPSSRDPSQPSEVSLPDDAVGVYALSGGWVGVCTASAGAVFARTDFSEVRSEPGHYRWSRNYGDCVADGDRLYWEGGAEIGTATPGETVAWYRAPRFDLGTLAVVDGIAFGPRDGADGTTLEAVDLEHRGRAVVHGPGAEVFELRVRDGALWWGSRDGIFRLDVRDRGDVERVVSEPTARFGVGPGAVALVGTDRRGGRGCRIADGVCTELGDFGWVDLVVTEDTAYYAEGNAVRGIRLGGTGGSVEVVRARADIDALATDGEQLFFTAEDRLYRRPVKR